MKKIVFLFCSLFVSLVMQAQVCKISDTTNDNVEVYSWVLNETKTLCVVTVGNDSQNVSANVSVTVEVTYGSSGNTKKNFTGKGLAKPNEPTEIKIPILPKVGNLEIKEVNVISITGTKCLTK